MFPAVGLGKSNHIPASPQWLYLQCQQAFYQCCCNGLNRLEPSPLWQEHADIIDCLTINMHPFLLRYTCVVEIVVSELIKVTHRGEVFTQVF